jgi:hypothetical protein
MDWQPIETAPRDGTPVLLYFAHYPIYEPDYRNAAERCEVGWFSGGVWHESGTAHDLFEPWRDKAGRPTHWMPLPPPPQTDSDRRE